MRSNTLRGFTLIELLVVIAIIALLAAILFPVFGKAREKARQTSCINNQKSFSTAIQIYIQDHEETLPLKATFWGDLRVDKGTMKCLTVPSLENAYLYNHALSGKGIGEICDTTTNRQQDLTLVWLTADGKRNSITATYPETNVAYLNEDIAYRHNNKAIVSYLDGHVDMRDLISVDPGGGNNSPVGGNPWAWGDNDDGRLGNGTTIHRSTPIQVTSLTGVIAVASEFHHSLALKNDGTVWAWGSNSIGGQLGDGTTTDHPTPGQVTGLTGVTAIAGGYYSSLALKGDSTVWTWGLNTYGQLGDGTTTNRSTPVQVTGLTGVIAVAGGYDHYLVLRNDGTVWAWGSNWAGDLGDGTSTHRSTPVQVTGLTGVTAVAGGHFFSLALKEDGTVWAWGSNSTGQLGDGTTTDRWTPVQVTGLTGVTAISAGRYHCLALKGDGTVWAWGGNWAGQLGDGTTSDRLVPMQIAGLTGVTAIAGKYNHGLALKGDSTVWAWGSNLYGELGDGTTTNRSTPVQITGLTGVTAISEGNFYSLVIVTPQ